MTKMMEKRSAMSKASGGGRERGVVCDDCNALCLIVYFIVYISLPHHFSGAIYKIAPSHASAAKSDPIFLPSTSKQCPCMCGVSAASKMRSCS